MPKSFANPQTFPANYPAALRSAAETPGIKIPLSSFSSLSKAKSESSRFLWYRRCLRSRPRDAQSLANLLDSYHFRTSISDLDGAWILWLIARPVDELLILNPDLAAHF